MSLNIKNARTHELVRRLAAATGQSQTSAVEDAVARRLAEVEAAGGEPRPEEDRRGEIDRALARFRADLIPADRERLRCGEAALHDESGLPR